MSEISLVLAKRAAECNILNKDAAAPSCTLKTLKSGTLTRPKCGFFVNCAPDSRAARGGQFAIQGVLRKKLRKFSRPVLHFSVGVAEVAQV